MSDYHRVICDLLRKNGEDEVPVVLATPLPNKSQPLVQVPPNLRAVYNAYARSLLASEQLKLEVTALSVSLFSWEARLPVSPAVIRNRLEKALQAELDMGPVYRSIFFGLMSRALGRTVDPRWSFIQSDWMLHQFGEGAGFHTEEEDRQTALPLEVVD